MLKRHGRLLLIFFASILGFSALALSGAFQSARAAGNKKVVMISIDGLRPEFYTENRFQTPTLKSLRDGGAYATGVEVSFPSLTYPNHTTLFTGVNPDKHGVLGNSIFTWEQGPIPAWYWEASKIKVPTIHDRANAAGLITASVRWPVTVQANVKFLVPEIFAMTGYYEGTDFDLTMKYTTPALATELQSALTLKKYTNEVEQDQWAAQAAAYILKTKKPDVMTIHLANVDHIEHGFGREAAQVNAAVASVDNDVKTIVAAIDSKDTCLIITGDHGFYDVSQSIKPNVLFAQKGWLHVDAKGNLTDWKVVAQAGGGQAVVYLKDKTLANDVLAVLKANQSAGYSIIDRTKLDSLHAYPEALVAIEGNPGFTMSQTFTGALVGPSGSLKGNHGYLPEHPELRTGFIANGCGETVGKNLGLLKNIDIAPTIAKILGLKQDGFDGTPIPL